MSKKKKLIETGKLAVIILLVISAGLLATQSGIFEEVIGSSGLFAGGGAKVSAQPNDNQNEPGRIQAQLPVTAAALLGSSGRYAVKYDGAAMESLYEKFSVIVGEALGSSSDPERVGIEQWRQALSGTGIYFDYLWSLPLPVLAGGLGTEISSQTAADSARYICVAAEEDGLALYYISRSDGEAYRCSTALSNSTIDTRLAEFAANSAWFAFELGGAYADIDPYVLLVKEIPDIYAAEVSGPADSDLDSEQLLNAFGMNVFVATAYVDANGTQVFVEDDMVLYVESDGTVEFRRGQLPEQQEPGATAVVKAVRIAQKAIGEIVPIMDADMVISSVGYDAQTDSYTVCFDYMLNGIPVVLAQYADAAQITLTAGVITEAKIHLKLFRLQSEALLVLPELQAAAIIQSAGGGEISLVYKENAGMAAPIYR